MEQHKKETVLTKIQESLKSLELNGWDYGQLYIKTIGNSYLCLESLELAWMDDFIFCWESEQNFLDDEITWLKKIEKCEFEVLQLLN